MKNFKAPSEQNRAAKAGFFLPTLNAIPPLNPDFPVLDVFPSRHAGEAFWEDTMPTGQWEDGISKTGQGRFLLPANLMLRLADYTHPQDVLQDDALTHAQKRDLLAAWASDLSAVESRPGFRWLDGTPGPIPVSHILAALQALDQKADPSPDALEQGKGARGGAAGRQGPFAHHGGIHGYEKHHTVAASQW
jgi:hypothetical protein